MRFFLHSCLCGSRVYAFEMLAWIHRPWGSVRQQEEEGCVVMDPNISLANDVL